MIEYRRQRANQEVTQQGVGGMREAKVNLSHTNSDPVLYRGVTDHENPF